MNRVLVFALILAGFGKLCAVEPPETYQLVDCGADKAVLIRGTESQDLRYAIGWTIRPKRKDAKPVDWSAWNKQDDTIFAFLDGYEVQERDHPNAAYEVNNCVIDLKEKKRLLLPSDWPYWPHKNRGYIDAIWSLSFGDSRYALVQNDSRFYTHNLWLVVIDRDSMRQLDLASRVERAVAQFIHTKKPSTADRYGTFYPLHRSEFGSSPNASFKPSSAEVPFFAAVPKSDDPTVTGRVVLNLPDGSVRKITGTP